MIVGAKHAQPSPIFNRYKLLNMKYIPIIIIFLLIGCKCKQNKSRKLPTLSKNDSIRYCEALKLDDTLRECTLTYIYGDEFTSVNIMHISKVKNKYFAENIEPLESVGTIQEKQWKVELNADQIKLYLDYINKARIIANTKYSIRYISSKASTSRIRYQIDFNNDTVKVPSVHWDDLNFLEIRKTIFNKFYAELENERQKIIDNTKKKLIGLWYLNNLSDNLNGNDSIILYKKHLKNNCTWKFLENYSFESTCSSFPYSTDYVIDVYGNNISLQINAGWSDSSGIKLLKNFDETFEIVYISENKMILKSYFR